MFGESGASGKICIWSAALTQWHKQKQLSSNVNVDVGPNGGCFLPRRSAQHGISPFVQRTTACANAFRQRLAFSISFARAYNAPHIAEG
jgi:hypothetical protein